MDNIIGNLDEDEEGLVEEVPFEEYVLEPAYIDEEGELLEEPMKPQPPKKVKRFRCNTCNLLCSSPSTLQVHIRTHTGERPYECSYCDYRGAAPFAVRAHMRTHTGERPFACDFCNFRSAHSTDLTIHMRRHTGEKPYSCAECSYKSASKSAIQAHMTTHSKVKHLKCMQCEYRCSSKQLLTFHLRTHLSVKPFKCDFCKYSAVTKSLIKVHMRIHTGEKPYKCSVCDYACRAKSGLRSHMRKHETNALQCRHCSYVAPSNYAVLLHEKIHSSAPKKTQGKSAVRREKKKPAKKTTKNTTVLPVEKSLACLMCDDSFATTEDWLAHLATHGSGALKFRCGFCDFTTASRQNLTNHRKWNHETVDQELHFCPICRQSFTRKDNLRRHLANGHGGNESQSSEAGVDFDTDTIPETGEFDIGEKLTIKPETAFGEPTEITPNSCADPTEYRLDDDSNLSEACSENRSVEILDKLNPNELKIERAADYDECSVDIDEDGSRSDGEKHKANSDEIETEQYLLYFNANADDCDVES